MATIINNPSDSGGDSSGVGLIFGVIVAVLLIGLFLVYFLPELRNNNEQTGTKIEVKLPTTPTSPTPSN